MSGALGQAGLCLYLVGVLLAAGAILLVAPPARMEIIVLGLEILALIVLVVGTILLALEVVT